MNRPWTSGGKRDQDAIAATGALVRERDPRFTGADDASRLGVEHSADDQAFVDSVSVWPEE